MMFFVENDIDETTELNEESLEEVAGGKGGHKKVIATANANLRSGPGKDYPVVGKAVTGLTATWKETRADEQGNAWYKVSHNGSTDWIAAKYAKFI